MLVGVKPGVIRQAKRPIFVDDVLLFIKVLGILSKETVWNMRSATMNSHETALGLNHIITQSIHTTIYRLPHHLLFKVSNILCKHLFLSKTRDPDLGQKIEARLFTQKIESANVWKMLFWIYGSSTSFGRYIMLETLYNDIMVRVHQAVSKIY